MFSFIKQRSEKTKENNILISIHLHPSCRNRMIPPIINLYRLIAILHNESSTSYYTCVLIKNEISNEAKRTKYSKMHDEIHEIWKKFEDREITVRDLLKKCSRLNGP